MNNQGTPPILCYLSINPEPIISKAKYLLFIFLIVYSHGFSQQQNTKDSSTLFYVLPQEIRLDSSFIFSKIDSIAQMGIKEKAFPGCQILAAKDGAIFFHKTYGFHTYDSIEPVKRTDLYDFASVTKITAPLPAIMKLYDEGKIELDTPFYHYWPDFKNSNKQDITLREILAHQAQLQPWISFWKMTLKKNGRFKRTAFKENSSNRHLLKVAEGMYLHKKYRKKIYKSIKNSPILDEKKYKYSGLSFL